MSGYAEQRKFIGQEYDAETGLNYLNARYYNANTGRFVSEDPMFWNFDQAWLADPQNQNSYAYARNNPIILSDPSGKSWTTFGQGVGESLVATLIIAGAIAAIPVAIPAAVVTGLAIVGTGAAMYGTYQNYQSYNSGQISKDQFDYNSGALLGGLALPYGMGKLAEGGQAVNLSKLGETKIPEIQRTKLPTAAQKLLSEYESNGWQKAISGETSNPRIFRNDKNPLPDKGYIFDAQYKAPQGQNTDRFVKNNDGNLYYTNNHYGDGSASNDQPSFHKVINTKK